MMKRILSIIGLTAVAVVFALAQITVDGNPSEWTGTPPTENNTWKYSAGTAGGLNEWIWKDAQGDERTDFASPDTRVDILEVRIASNATYLYFLIKMTNIDLTSGDGAPMVQISIDRDRTAGSGNVWLAGYPETQVNVNAAWEYLVTTRFATGHNNLRIFPSGTITGTAVISADNDVIEGAIPWSAIGGSPNNYTLRLTFSSYRAWPDYGSDLTSEVDDYDNAWDIGGDGESDALDVVTTAGPNTWDEVSDGVIDYYVDIQFLNDQTLPVQAVSLVAITGNSKVTLVWETGSEFNNAGFEIYRKAQDETDFKYIAGYQTNPELRGLGTSSHGKRYTYTDENVKGGATYVYKIYAVDFNGNRQEFGSITANVVAEIPNKYVLYQNYPNPFNPGTEIRFDLPKSGNVKLEIFNSLGEKVAVLYDGFMEAGYGKVVRWNASGFPSGVYYYRLTADGFVDVKKMVLMK
jgi:hypothetical protein